MKIPEGTVLETGCEYCADCFQETVERRDTPEGVRYVCTSCGASLARRVSTDSVKWWMDADRELWHESAGVFVRNAHGEILFFELTKFPFGCTVPAGHVGPDEDPADAARRELAEETGLHTNDLTLLGTEDISGDLCGRGADMHRWSAFAATMSNEEIRLDAREGKNPVWLSIDAALEKELTVPVRKFLERYAQQLNAGPGK